MARAEGKTAFITGAARGIGAACADLLSQHGAAVVLADLDHDAARATAILLDVTSADAWPKALAKAESAMGGINVLVNSAGICIPGTIEDLDIADWTRTIDIDLNSVFLGCRYAMPILRRSAPASIVNISSISGLIAGHNMAAYNAAKAGVWMLTKSVALHAARSGDDVRVNSVHPAFIDTGMVDAVVGGSDPRATREKLARQVPLGRIGTVSDVAYAVLYLASDESRFMTGAELKLDGGISAM